MSTEPPDPLSGTAYRTLSHLGKGGMGFVVAAEHVALRKLVVVKLLHESMAGAPHIVERFRIEGQALASLRSRHIVEVTDLGTTPSGRPFLVMEKLEGRTLKEELKARGWIPLLEAIEYTRQILDGLAAAHRKGIVHRDVKLDNVFLVDADDGSRFVKVLDFGIAKLVADVAALAPSRFQTEEGVLLGTPRFAAPEQIRSAANVDARADIYATGVLLYSLLKGQGPFAHVHGVPQLLVAHVSEQPKEPSIDAPQAVPPALDAAVLKALAKHPEDRFQTAEAFAQELSAIAKQIPSSGAAAGTRWPKTEKIAAAPLRELAARPASSEPRALAARGTVKIEPVRATPEPPPAPSAPPFQELRTDSVTEPLPDRRPIPEAADRATAERLTERRGGAHGLSTGTFLLFAGLCAITCSGLVVLATRAIGCSP